MNVSVASSRNSCLNCATNKAGKRSCCARGGAWFKNCGGVGDTQFNHTWTDGILACEGFTTLFLVKSSLKSMPHHVESIGLAQSRNNTQRQMDIHRPKNTSTVGTMESQNCNEIGEFAVCNYMYVLLIILVLQAG